MVDVFAVDVLGCWGGRDGSAPGGVFLFEAVEFEAGFEFVEEAHFEGGWLGKERERLSWLL